MQLDDLWNFMQVDMEADKFESQMRLSPNRQKLLKQRNFILEQQGNMKKLEADVAVMQDRLEAVGDEAKRLEGVLAGIAEQLRANPPADVEESDRRAEAAQHLAETLARYDAVDMNVYAANLFHTRMMIKDIDLQNYLFKTDVYELPPTTRLDITNNLRREMIEIYSGKNIY